MLSFWSPIYLCLGFFLTYCSIMDRCAYWVSGLVLIHGLESRWGLCDLFFNLNWYTWIFSYHLIRETFQMCITDCFYSLILISDGPIDLSGDWVSSWMSLHLTLLSPIETCLHFLSIFFVGYWIYFLLYYLL